MTTHRDDTREEEEDSLFERFHDRLVGRPREFGGRVEGNGAERNGEEHDDGRRVDAALGGTGALVAETVATDDDTGTANRADPVDGTGGAGDGASAATGDRDAGDDRPSRRSTATAERSTDGLAEALAAELAAGEVDEDTRRRLAAGLRAGLDTPTRVRLDQLSARVAELDAYADALETVLERVGTDDDIVERFERLAAETAAVERGAREERTRVRADLDEVTDDIASLRTEVDERVAGADTLGDEVDTLRAGLDELTDETDALRSDFDDLARETGALRAEVATLHEWRRQLTGAFVTDGGASVSDGAEVLDGTDAVVGDDGAWRTDRE
ncbi:hypothetical protein ACFO0N_08075 [Halobium salinum]|uniref:Uncharacterized protein n=1 Tax=Halobium salinum TaxID=1364940 RepID=A0ABD5PAK8_9EURY|nr:hypothetical protein [Halobium salinum]